MQMFQMLFLLFLIVPIAEIFLLLKVGSLIGAMPTVMLVVGTALLGAWMLRIQGFATWQRLQRSMAEGEIPALEMVEGPILLVGGALLLTPGFVTDILGFICLIPQTRRKIAVYVLTHRFQDRGAGPGEGSAHRSYTIDGDFKRED